MAIFGARKVVNMLFINEEGNMIEK